MIKRSKMRPLGGATFWDNHLPAVITILTPILVCLKPKILPIRWCHFLWQSPACVRCYVILNIGKSRLKRDGVSGTRRFLGRILILDSILWSNVQCQCMLLSQKSWVCWDPVGGYSHFSILAHFIVFYQNWCCSGVSLSYGKIFSHKVWVY